MDITVIEITNKEHKKLPERYISFPDGVDAAVTRLEQIEDKLRNRGLVVVKPYNAIRIKFFEGTTKEFYQLAFELKKKE